MLGSQKLQLVPVAPHPNTRSPNCCRRFSFYRQGFPSAPPSVAHESAPVLPGTTWFQLIDAQGNAVELSMQARKQDMTLMSTSLYLNHIIYKCLYLNHIIYKCLYLNHIICVSQFFLSESYHLQFFLSESYHLCLTILYRVF